MKSPSIESHPTFGSARLVLPAVVLTLCLASPLWAQVVINEYMASNLASFPDNYGRYEDWIEPCNAGASPVDLEGHFLSNKALRPRKCPGISSDGAALTTSGAPTWKRCAASSKSGTSTCRTV